MSAPCYTCSGTHCSGCKWYDVLLQIRSEGVDASKLKNKNKKKKGKDDAKE